MAYTVSFGTITKRENSTSQSYTEALSASCLLKDATDVLRPTFSLAAQINGDTLLPCNYMYVAAFGRYYWITGIEFYHGVWYVSGEVDVLASYKSAIGNTQAYILRAASEYDDLIPDDMVPFGVNEFQLTTSAGKTIGWSSEGIVLICCAGVDSVTDSPSQSYYAMVPYMWDYIYGYCFTSGFLTDMDNAWSGISSLLLNATVRPEDYISSAIWLPIDYSSIDVLPSYVKIGYTETAAVGKNIGPDTLLLSDSVQFTIPDHNQVTQYGRWLNGNGARKLTISLPGYGLVSIDCDLNVNMPNPIIDVSWAVDCSGVITYKVDQRGARRYFTADISTPVGWAVSRPNVAGAISAVGGLAASAATGSALGAMASVGNALRSAMPRVEQISTGGSRTLAALAPSVTAILNEYRLPGDIDYATIGRPLCSMRTINTLSGYIQCSETASVSCSGTREEIDKINAYLAGGFYYE